MLEDGGGRDGGVPGLRNDIPGECGGRPALEESHRRFGKRVAKIVEGCTDTFEKPKPPWKERKEAYLEHLRTASRSVLLVSAADKVHNARTIVSDYRAKGESIWERFSAGKAGQFWYSAQLVQALRMRWSTALVDGVARCGTRSAAFGST